jgi:hypothetical protein
MVGLVDLLVRARVEVVVGNMLLPKTLIRLEELLISTSV